MTHPAEQSSGEPPVGRAPGQTRPAAPTPGHSYPTPGHSYPTPGHSYPAAGFGRPVGPGGAPLAEFWQRLLAYIIDSLIQGAALLIPMLLVFALVFVPYLASADPARVTPGEFVLLEVLAIALVLALQVAASYVYFVRVFHKTGQTIGKRAMSIRVVSVTGGPLDLRAARRRWVVQHMAGVVATYFNLADGLWQLWDQPLRQCLHDKCAETVVVQVMA